MKILAIGGGPAGLYFAILMKKANPAHEITVVERHEVADTFGFGVVFSDATMDNLAAADRQSYDDIRGAFYHWEDIDILYRSERLRSTGHGFAGMSRPRLLEILADRAAELGVDLRFGTEITHPGELEPADLVIAGDGVNSHVRDLYAEDFEPQIDLRPNRFVWLGTTRPYPAFTFDFAEDEHGL